MFKELSDIMRIPDVALEEYKVRMNKWDDELRDFMLSAEKKCRRFKNNQIERIPTIKMWLGRRRVSVRLQKVIAKGKQL